MDHSQIISELLPVFAGVSLEEIENAPSMNRVDIKYIIPATSLPDIMINLKNSFRILEIDNSRSFQYESTYYDTEDFLFYHQHMTGRLERYKVRYRKYLASDTAFLEVKITTNKRRTVKWRIRTDHQHDLQKDVRSSGFLMKYLPQPSPVLGATIKSSFDRVTLTDMSLNERITIDSGLSFSDMNGNNTQLPSISIIELKKERAGNRSELPGILKKFSVQPCGFSKYCYGAATLHDLPRKNLLKSKILLINKIENEHTRYVFAGR
jgi:hypothetical protein